VQNELPRIQRIFKHGIPVITVSQSLAEDIKTFSRQPLLKSYLVPNVVDKANFHKYEECTPGGFRSFFMLSQWKWPKEPEVIIRAFSQVSKLRKYQDHILRIGGFGILVTEMQALADSLGLNDRVVFLGSMNPETIAIEMNKCEAFLHCTQYETFSVVCAEALSCGAPVIASEVGGIAELIDSSNGILVKKNTIDDWFLALMNLSECKFDRMSISTSAHERFSPERVGLLYLNVLKEISDAEK
jgi:glycosyltransferase involved in cell wall biosynthesis